MTGKIVVLLNHRSGPPYRRVSIQELEQRLALQNVAAEVIELRLHEQVHTVAEQMVHRGYAVVVAAGGDGTVSAVASAVAGTSSALAVLPIGTFNHFARDLRVPLDLDGAIGVLAQGRTDCVDIAEVNGRKFVNNSSIGMYPRLVMLRDRGQRSGRNRWTALAIAVFAVLRRFPFSTVRVHVKGKVVEQRSPFVFIGNNEYELQGLELGHRTMINGGRLFLYVSGSTTRLQMLGTAIGVWLGRLDTKRSLHMFDVPEATIETRRRHIRVSTDGEVCRMRSPLHYRLLPLALRVIVP